MDDVFEVYKDGTKKVRRYRWRRIASNGRIVATSGQGFTRRWSAKRAARRVDPTLDVRDY